MGALEEKVLKDRQEMMGQMDILAMLVLKDLKVIIFILVLLSACPVKTCFLGFA